MWGSGPGIEGLTWRRCPTGDAEATFLAHHRLGGDGHALLCRQFYSLPADVGPKADRRGNLYKPARAVGGNNAHSHRLATVSAVALVFFALAYLRLDAGAGALILIGAVQLSMFSIAFWEGERFTSVQWIGLSLALFGFVYLLLPGASAPHPMGGRSDDDFRGRLGVVFLAGPWRQTSVGSKCQQPSVLPAPLPPGELIHPTRSRSHHCWRASCDRLGCDRDGSRLCCVVSRLAQPAGRRRSHRAAIDAGSRRPRGAAFLSEPLTLRLLVASAALLGGIALVLQRRVDGARW